MMNNVCFFEIESTQIIERHKLLASQKTGTLHYTHPPAGLVVVQVHETAGGVGVLLHVEELPAEPLPVAHVLRAASPLPVPRLLVSDRVVARAVRQLALRARPRHRERDAGSGDGGEVRGFSASFKKEITSKVVCMVVCNRDSQFSFMVCIANIINA